MELERVQQMTTNVFRMLGHLTLRERLECLRLTSSAVIIYVTDNFHGALHTKKTRIIKM